MATVFTATGAKVYIAPSRTAEPASAASYAGLSWTEIKMLESIGDYGDESSEITAAVIGDGRMRKAKGARNAGTTPLVCFPDSTDAGQVAVIAAEATYNLYPFKVELPNKLAAPGQNQKDYFLGLVMSKRTNIGRNDDIVRQTFNVGVNSKITTAAPTAS